MPFVTLTDWVPGMARAVGESLAISAGKAMEGQAHD